MAKLVVTPDLAGQRLDAVLAQLCPSLGLRGRRRLIAAGSVLVNAKQAKAAQRLREGDSVVLDQKAKTSEISLRILHEDEKYVFLAKPRFLHTALIAGSPQASLEEALRQLPFSPILLQRLDYATSGIVCAAKNAAVYAQVREDERAGRVCKKYAALVEGELREPAVLRARLNTDSCRRTKVCAEEGERNRVTLLEPFAVFPAGSLLPPWTRTSIAGELSSSLTLVGCTLFCGARHQIRAHCASLGHPLLGDTMYGACMRIPGEPEGAFYLHQGAIFLPDASSIFMPEWLANDPKNPLLTWFKRPGTLLSK